MIEVVGTEGSSEYRAALMVRDALETAWPASPHPRLKKKTSRSP